MRTKERGVAVVFALFAIVLVSGLVFAFVGVARSASDSGQAQLFRLQAQYLAEAGVNDAFATLVPTVTTGATVTLGSEGNPVRLGGGAYWASATDNSDSTITVLASGRQNSQVVTIEARVRKATSLRDFAIFAGNQGTEATELGGTLLNRDIVTGNIHVNGSLAVKGGAMLNGDASATGTITGTGVTGTKSEGVQPLTPPNLKAMNYETIADFKINSSTPFDGNGFLPASDPRHIFAKEFRDDLATTSGYTFSNTNYFLGDIHEDSGIAEISVPAAGNRKVYYVDGNLWIEPQGETLRVINGQPGGTVITVIVKGNIYFSDTLAYQDATKDGILLVAMSDGESYTDLNGNNKHDAGEPLLHDDGDGVYEGNNEGSGNVYFGDPNGGPLGHVQAFVYAENNFEDQVSQNGMPLPFQVTGFMSAGNQVRINRDIGGTHAQMIVNSDPRLVSGALQVPGFPGAITGGSSFELLGWRFARRGGP